MITRPPVRRPLVWTVASLALVAVLLWLAGCRPVSYVYVALERTPTQEQAETSAREHVEEAVAALPDEARSVPREGPRTTECHLDSPSLPSGQVTVNVSHRIEGLDPDHTWRDIELLLDHWKENGYRVVHDRRPERASVYVEHETDHFRLSVRARDHEFLIGAASPCIWPEGTRNAAVSTVLPEPAGSVAGDSGGTIARGRPHEPWTIRSACSSLGRISPDRICSA